MSHCVRVTLGEGPINKQALHSQCCESVLLQGRLSKYGLLSMAGRWEVPGIVARTVSDAALLLALAQGPVSLDLQTLVLGTSNCEGLQEIREEHLQNRKGALTTLHLKFYWYHVICTLSVVCVTCFWYRILARLAMVNTIWAM